MYDIIIVGKGPAGISAALYCKRAGLSVLVIGMGYGALEKAEKIENYYGLGDAFSGKDIVMQGWKQAERLEIKIISFEVVDITWDGTFTVLGNLKSYQAKSVIIATGTQRNVPKISGIKELEGKGVSYCAVCDAFFYRGKNVAVLGNGSYALHEAQELIPTAANVTILTNGQSASGVFEGIAPVNEKAIKQILGSERVEGILFEDGSQIEVDGFFVALGTAGAGSFARKLGLETNGNYLAVDDKKATAVPGLFAAGDCIGGVQQISNAAAEGTVAALSTIAYIRKLAK